MKNLLVYIVKEKADDTFVILEGTVNNEVFKTKSGVKLNTKHLSNLELLTDSKIEAMQRMEANNFYIAA